MQLTYFVHWSQGEKQNLVVDNIEVGEVDSSMTWMYLKWMPKGQGNLCTYDMNAYLTIDSDVLCNNRDVWVLQRFLQACQ